MEKLFLERIEENKEQFTENELNIIDSNKVLFKKIYLLGLINGREIYKDF